MNKTGASLGCETQVAPSLGNGQSSRVASDTTVQVGGDALCSHNANIYHVPMGPAVLHALKTAQTVLFICSLQCALTWVFSFRRRKTQSPSLPLSPRSLTVLLCPVPGGEHGGHSGLPKLAHLPVR